LIGAAIGIVAWQWDPILAGVSEYAAMLRVEGHDEDLRKSAAETGVDVNLLAGVMMVESRGNVRARSEKDALGLFQLMLPTAQERAALLDLPEPSKRDLLSDAALNTRLGAHHLAWLLKRYGGDEEAALIAYNAGSGRLDRWIKEAGSYAAWRAERESAGNSDVLPYARNVLRYRDEFASRGNLAIGPRLPPTSPDSDPAEPPTAPTPDVDRAPLAPPARDL
jgi:soluble lytic murein transglycosylase-like protein